VSCLEGRCLMPFGHRRKEKVPPTRVVSPTTVQCLPAESDCEPAGFNRLSCHYTKETSSGSPTLIVTTMAVGL
jgi:hypothetical protein